jgi:hypothetical protein
MLATREMQIKAIMKEIQFIEKPKKIETKF